MYHTYRYQVIVMQGSTRVTYSGQYTNLRSESEAIATLKRQYMNIVDYDVWEV